MDKKPEKAKVRKPGVRKPRVTKKPTGFVYTNYDRSFKVTTDYENGRIYLDEPEDDCSTGTFCEYADTISAAALEMADYKAGDEE